MRRVMVIYGTRPEAIKMAPLVRALEEHAGLIPIVVVTGQHREMLDQVNELFGIVPDHDLDLMVPGAGLAQVSSRALAGVDEIIASERPDAIVVQGDTSTAFNGALAAFYAQVPVVHLEAGLRTNDLRSPFPEEANRRLTACVTSLHLAPTAVARENLVAEGFDRDSIAVTGNTVIDALHSALASPVVFTDPSVRELVASASPFVLVTAHRRESWGEPMREAMSAVRDLAGLHPEVRWLLPMHPNPVVRAVVTETLSDLDNVTLCEPLTYHEFCHAMTRATLLLTDSGGVQEEAPSLGKPVLVMRDTTERPEGVDAGAVRLVGTRREDVVRQVDRLLTDSRAYGSMARAVNPFGDGRAAARAVEAIAEMLGVGRRLPDFAPSHQPQETFPKDEVAVGGTHRVKDTSSRQRVLSPASLVRAQSGVTDV